MVAVQNLLQGLKNPFEFPILNVIKNDSEKRESITIEQMEQFLEFVKNDKHYSKYYDAIYILFHTGLRISEFCGLTIHDIDMKERTIDINHQLQRLSDMEYLIEPTKTNAGKRVLPMTPDVYMILLLIRYVTDGIRARKRIANHIRRTQEN